MKILIADDEKMARLSLQSMLEELYPDENRYEFAVDGADMLNKLDSFAPSIVILDIKMPRLSGLEALEQCRRDYPDTMFIISSGYSDFEFARKALSLGVTEYLLKPVDIESLKAAVEKAKEMLNKQDSLRQNAFDGAVYGYLADEADYEDNASLFNSLSGSYKLFYICRDGSCEPDTSRMLLRQITHFCVEASNSDDLFSCHYLPSGKLCLILNSDRKITYRRFFTQLCESNKYGVITVFCDEDFSIRNIRQKVENLEELSSIRCLGLAGGLIDCNLLPANIQSEGMLNFARTTEEFFTAYTYSPSESEDSINALREREAEYRLLYDTLPKSALSSYFFKVTGAREDLSDYDAFLEAMSKLVHDFRKSEYDDSVDIIKRAKKYVSDNYKSGISISEVADALSLSPAYLSRLFHSKTGEKYIDYVTRVRMAAAEKIFKDHPGISTKKVAEEVGYFSTRHFKEMYTRYIEKSN